VAKLQKLGVSTEVIEALLSSPVAVEGSRRRARGSAILGIKLPLVNAASELIRSGGAAHRHQLNFKALGSSEVQQAEQFMKTY
jgi:hypothetical protein